MRSTPPLWIGLTLVLCSLLASARPGFAHGGVFRGPGSLPPGSGTATGKEPQGTDPLGWDRWWRFNQDRYLRLKDSVWRAETVTGSDGFFLGRGQRTAPAASQKPTDEDLQGKVVPTLLRLLRTERSNDIQTAAAIALAKVGGGADDSSGATIQTALQSKLDDANQEVSETAAIALGILGRDASTQVLAALLANSERGRELVGGGDVNNRTRAFAAYGLGLVAHRTEREDVRRFAVQKLIAALAEDSTASQDVPVAAVIALGLIPLELAADDELELKRSPTSSRQGLVLALMERLDDPQTHAFVRGHVPVSLARLADGLSLSWKERIVRSLSDKLAPFSSTRDEIQEGAVQALGLLIDGDSDPVDREGRATLIRLTEQGSEEVRRFALIALARSAARPGGGNEKALETVRALLQRRLIRSPTLQRPWAGLALAELESTLLARGEAAESESLDLLRKTLKRSISPEEVGGLAISVGIARDREARSALTQKLGTMREDSARGSLAIGLGMIGARDSIEGLQKLVDESRFRPRVLRDSATALALLGDRTIVDELTAMIAKAKSLSSQAAVASALGFIGDRRALDPLLAMASRKELVDGARAFAVVALGIVGDKEPLPWNAKLAADVNYAALPATLSDAGGRGILDIL